MGVRDVISTVVQLPALLKLKKAMTPRPPDEQGSLGELAERNATMFGERTALVFEGESVTWAELNARANRFAGVLRDAGVEPGDAVSVMMQNSIDMLAVVLAANKIGLIASLINTNLTGRPLSHCLTVTQSKKCVFGAELSEAIAGVKSELHLEEGSDYLFVPDNEAPAPNWATDFMALSQGQSEANPADTANRTLGEQAFHIFTSGTTGLPKAAIVSNWRCLMGGGAAARGGLRITEKDRLYCCMPLYHGSALIIGFGAVLDSGASMFLRRRFSASAFLGDVREHGCTALLYIGELCRYLMATPPLPDDANNPVRTAMGNGLRPDLWLDFKSRFGIERISEFYAASEGNISFANFLNKDCTIGLTSNRVAVVAYDVDADEIVPGDDGKCRNVASGEPGLLLGHINPLAKFEGYTDAEATERKIVRDAFEEGDAWFNTGDLIREVDVGFTLGYPHYQFVDRVGDTFRWKSENVSTNEVGEILNGFDDVEFCNVYGVEVPGSDGRAGMAAVRLAEGVDGLRLDALAAWVNRELPSYARPIFVRQQSDIDVTGTFKMVKGDLRREAYDITAIDDPVFVMKPGSSEYELLDEEYLKTIQAGEAGF